MARNNDIFLLSRLQLHVGKIFHAVTRLNKPRQEHSPFIELYYLYVLPTRALAEAL